MKGVDVKKGEVSLNLGSLLLLGRIEGEFDTNEILLRIIDILEPCQRVLTRLLGPERLTRRWF